MAGSGFGSPIQQIIPAGALIPAFIFEDGNINPASLDGAGKVRVITGSPNSIGFNSITPLKDNAVYLNDLEIEGDTWVRGGTLNHAVTNGITRTIGGDFVEEGIYAGYNNYLLSVDGFNNQNEALIYLDDSGYLLGSLDTAIQGSFSGFKYMNFSVNNKEIINMQDHTWFYRKASGSIGFQIQDGNTPL